MLKHIKKTFLPVMLCLVLCTCTACTSRSKEETETSETETDSAVSAYQNVLREIRQNHIFPGSGTEFAWEESLSIYYAIVDVNQDGIVYLLTNAKGKKTAIDTADLKKWVDSYHKGAKEIPITYQRLK